VVLIGDSCLRQLFEAAVLRQLPHWTGKASQLLTQPGPSLRGTSFPLSMGRLP